MAKSSEAQASKPVGRSVDEFRKTYDKSYIVPSKIKAALAKLGDGWLREIDFAKLAEVSTQDLSAYREPFEDHTVPLTGAERGKRAWCGTVAFANKLRKLLGILP